MKRFIVMLVVFVFACGTVASADPWRVFDNAGLFSAEDIEAIEQAISDFQRETSMDFAVLTTNDYLGKSNQKAIADSFYDSSCFGFGQQASGLLYYIDMNQRIPYISTTGKMIAIFDNTRTEAHDNCYSFLVDGAYKDAVLKMIECATEAISTYEGQ